MVIWQISWYDSLDIFMLGYISSVVLFLTIVILKFKKQRPYIRQVIDRIKLKQLLNK